MSLPMADRVEQAKIAAVIRTPVYPLHDMMEMSSGLCGNSSATDWTASSLPLPDGQKLSASTEAVCHFQRRAFLKVVFLPCVDQLPPARYAAIYKSKNGTAPDLNDNSYVPIQALSMRCHKLSALLNVAVAAEVGSSNCGGCLALEKYDVISAHRKISP
jgi:hypothetical protein